MYIQTRKGKKLQIENILGESGRCKKDNTVQVQTKSLNSAGKVVLFSSNRIGRCAIVHHGNLAEFQIALKTLERGNLVMLENLLEPTSSKQMTSIPDGD